MRDVCWALDINWVPYMFKWPCIRNFFVSACRLLMLVKLVHFVMVQSALFEDSEVYAC